MNGEEVLVLDSSQEVTGMIQYGSLWRVAGRLKRGSRKVAVRGYGWGAERVGKGSWRAGGEVTGTGYGEVLERLHGGL